MKRNIKPQFTERERNILRALIPLSRALTAGYDGTRQPVHLEPETTHNISISIVKLTDYMTRESERSYLSNEEYLEEGNRNADKKS